MTKVYDAATDLITFARSSSATYLDSDGVIKTAATDAPRIEYAADGSLKGLLIEEQRTNLIYPSGFPTAGTGTGFGGPNNSTAAVDQTGPDGLTSATTLTATSTTTEVRWRITTTQASSTTYTLSFYAKAGSSAYIYARNIAVSGDPAIDGVWWDVSDFSVASTGTGITVAGSQSVGNGWYRCYITATTASSIANNLVDIGIADTAGTLLGTSGETGIFYGAQLELGSFPTSYIPTSGSQSTRSPDIASIPVSAFGYNQTNTVGTFFVEASSFGAAGSKVLTATNGSNRAVDVGTNPTTPRVDVYSNHTGGDLYNLSPASAGINKVAAAMAENNSAACANGGTVKTDTVTSTPVVATQLEIGSYIGGQQLNGHIKSLKYFPRRLTDAQLQELTS